MTNQAQLEKVKAAQGFIAALDQSGGSTPKALEGYGIAKDSYADEEEMYDAIHDMRTRIIKAPDFTGDKVVGAILFENTMDRTIDGQPTPQYLWNNRGVVPFLKVDKGLRESENDVKLMRDIPDLDTLLLRAAKLGVFGTKMRSVIDGANPTGIEAIVAQQFELGRQIMANGLVPILEPEVTISIDAKAQAEHLLKDSLLAHLDTLSDDQNVMLKVTLPEVANLYADIIAHPRVISVVALSGGYSRTEANARLAQNSGIIASFSRALTEGLNAQQVDDEFNYTLGDTINSIYQASVAG